MKNMIQVSQEYDKIIDRIMSSQSKQTEICPQCMEPLRITLDRNEQNKIISSLVECKKCEIRIRTCDK
jgi:hypothetical protein